MATYVPNAQTLSEPTGSRLVGSAAEEFRVLKSSLDSRADVLESSVTTINGSLSQAQTDVAVLQTQLAAIGLGTDSVALAANLASTADGKGASLVGYARPEVGAVARTVLVKLRESVSVRDFGAVGDGITNDLSAFIAAGAALSSGMSLYIPSGTYILDFTGKAPTTTWNTLDAVINLGAKNTISFRGDGWSSKVVMKNLDGTTSGGWSFIKTSEGAHTITLQDFWLDMQPITGMATYTPSYPRYFGLCASKTSKITLDGMKFTSFNPNGAGPTNDGGVSFTYKQIAVYADGYLDNNTIRGFQVSNCQFGEFNDAKKMNTYCIFIFGISDTCFENNKFYKISGYYPTIRNLVYASSNHYYANNIFMQVSPSDYDAANSIDHMAPGAMMIISNFAGDTVRNVKIVNNHFSLAGAGGINFGSVYSPDPGAVRGVIVANNTFEDVADMSGILTVEATNQSCINLITGTDFANMQITGNSVSSPVFRKFADIAGATDVVIQNNVVSGCAAYFAKIVDVKRHIISNNIVGEIAQVGSARVGIFSNLTGFSSTDRCTVRDNTITSTGGTAIACTNFSPSLIAYSGNIAGGGIFPLQTGVYQTGDITQSTFTPTAVGTTTAGVGTYGTQQGSATTVGNRCMFQIYLSWSAHTGIGNLRISGLPATAAASKAAACAVWSNNLTLTASNVLQAYVSGNQVVLQQVPTGGGSATNVAIDTAADLIVCGVYEISI